PFSSTLTCDAARPMAVPRSPSVIPRLVRSWRMRLPMVRESDISLSCSSSDGAGGIRSAFHAQILKKTEKPSFFCRHHPTTTPFVDGRRPRAASRSTNGVAVGGGAGLGVEAEAECVERPQDEVAV